MKTFDERFTLIYPRIKALATRFASTTSVPAEEYESYLCEEFINVDAAFDASVNNSYAAYVGAMLETKAKRLAEPARKERKYYDSIVSLEVPDDSDEDARYPQEYVSSVDIEEQVFDVMFVEEQLANADEETRSILEEFFADPHASYREIGRRLGLHDKLVKRRLEAVAKKAVSQS